MLKKNIEQKIDRELRKFGGVEPHPAVFDRTWMRIEERLTDRAAKTRWVWRPWGHPVRWVAMAICLCAIITGYLYQGNDEDNNEIASHLMNVSNPVASLSRDENIIKLSTLLTDAPALPPEMTEDVKVEALSADEIFL